MQPAEANLVERSLNGDLAAFNQIVDQYQSQVYNVAARVLGNRTTAEDVTQETFIAAYWALKDFRGGNLRAWLLRIARNLCYDQLRSTKRRPERSGRLCLSRHWRCERAVARMPLWRRHGPERSHNTAGNRSRQNRPRPTRRGQRAAGERRRPPGP